MRSNDLNWYIQLCNCSVPRAAGARVREKYTEHTKVDDARKRIDHVVYTRACVYAFYGIRDDTSGSGTLSL